MSFTKAHFIAILWTLFLATSLLLPASAFEKFSFTNLLELDKLIHFILFFLLVVFWLLAILPTSKLKLRIKLLVLFASILYGIFLEFAQSTALFNRSFEYGDVIANTIGCLAGVISISMVFNIIPLLKKYLPFMHKLYK